MAKGKDSGELDLTKRSTEIANTPLPREKLPTDLQEILDKDDSLFEQIYDGTYVIFNNLNSTFEVHSCVS